MSDSILSIISDCLKKAENERNRDRGSGYNVQYLPCGHYREISEHEKDLLTVAKRRLRKGYFDAVICSSDNCPFCENNEE